MQLRHDLHVLDAICALLQPHPLAPSGHPVQAWCTPIMSTRFVDEVRPDALLALQLSTGSAVLALEIDEGTEHAPVIRDKLARYAEALRRRPGWHLVFVVGPEERAVWMAQLARRTAERDDPLVGRAWVTTIAGMRRTGLRAQLTSVGWRERGRTLASLCVDRPLRRTAAPVGSEAWLRILGSGSSDDVGEVFGSLTSEPNG